MLRSLPTILTDHSSMFAFRGVIFILQGSLIASRGAGKLLLIGTCVSASFPENKEERHSGATGMKDNYGILGVR